MNILTESIASYEMKRINLALCIKQFALPQPLALPNVWQHITLLMLAGSLWPVTFDLLSSIRTHNDDVDPSRIMRDRSRLLQVDVVR